MMTHCQELCSQTDLLLIVFKIKNLCGRREDQLLQIFAVCEHSIRLDWVLVIMTREEVLSLSSSQSIPLA